ADAVLHAHGLVTLLDRRVTTDALLAGPRVGVVHRLFIGAGAHAFPVALAAALVDEDDAVFFAFVDGLARAGRQTGRVGAMRAGSGQVKEPLVVRQGDVLSAGDVARAVVFSVVRVHPVFILGGEVRDDLVRFGRFVNGFSVVRFLCLPGLLPQLLENADVPGQRVRAVGLGFHIVPEHVLLTFAAGPRGLAGQ